MTATSFYQFLHRKPQLYRKVIYVTLSAELIIINDIHSMSIKKGSAPEGSELFDSNQPNQEGMDERQKQIAELTNKIRELQYEMSVKYGKVSYEGFRAMVDQ